MQDIGSGDLGCLNDLSDSAKKCSTGTTLTDDEFELPDADVSIRAIFLSSLGLDFYPMNTAERDALQAHTLFVDGVPFRFANTSRVTGTAGLRWASPGLTWSEGDTVQLMLRVDLSALNLPTLTASASPDPVTEGGQATITLTLSEPVDEVTSIQRRLRGTASYDGASDADYRYVSLPTFAAGSRTATTIIRTIDDNRVENCETVTWDITMWPGTYRAVHASFTMAISDNDGGNACVGGA